jgi:hypothetical protein
MAVNLLDSEVIEYKRKIINQLVSIPEIYNFISNTEITNPAQMVNKNIFSYMRVPDSTTTVKNYICFDYNSKKSNRNSAFKNCTINLGIICHEDTISTNYGNRHDVLGGIVLNSFNWTNILGFELELVSDTEAILENKYHVRTLQFVNLTTNNLCSKIGEGYV